MLQVLNGGVIEDALRLRTYPVSVGLQGKASTSRASDRVFDQAVGREPSGIAESDSSPTSMSGAEPGGWQEVAELVEDWECEGRTLSGGSGGPGSWRTGGGGCWILG